MKYLLIAVTSIFFLLSCSKDENIEDLVVGEWRLKKLYSSDPNDVVEDRSITLIFNYGNTGLMKFSTANISADNADLTYYLANNNRSLTFTLTNDEPITFTIQKIDRRELVLNRNGLTFEFDRR
ncbi:lipocalin family protein [Sphingobacterium corticis]|uniref:Lipocalin family protein n=1 Tax=Sphingobacterium corticis TaxID=1812823 RepID=A0ABW5NL71_9SPHI